MAFTCLAALRAGAETVEMQVAFDLRFRGLIAAEITGRARKTPEACAAGLRARMTGRAAVVARVRYDVQTERFRDGGA